MSKTDHQGRPPTPDRIRPGGGLRQLRRGELGSSRDSTSTVLTRTNFHAMLRTEIERAQTSDDTVLLVRASIRPLPGTGTDLRGRELPDELVGRLAAANDQTRVAALGPSQLMLAVPRLDQRTGGEQVMSGLLEALSAPVVIDGLPHHLGPRLGAAVLDDDNPTIDLLQEGTQLALNETDPERPAMMFHPFQRVRHDLRSELATDLRTAVVDGEITAAVEPVFELDSRRLVAYQAVARWNRPDHGVVPASEFTDLAAELGVEHVLQWQVLHQALALIPEPPKQPNGGTTEPLTLWFEVHPRRMLHPQFGALLADAAAVHDHVDIGLELTPTPHAGDDDVVSVLRRLTESGVRVAAGDFGLGNANLTVMRSLGFDAVKLDTSVTRSVASSGTAQNIVGALIAIATELGLETTGLGIDSEAQLETLQRLGCHLGQGQYLAASLPH